MESLWPVGKDEREITNDLDQSEVDPLVQMATVTYNTREMNCNPAVGRMTRRIVLVLRRRRTSGKSASSEDVTSESHAMILPRCSRKFACGHVDGG